MFDPVEKIRKIAKISDMSRGYPANPKERGAHFWQDAMTAVRGMCGDLFGIIDSLRSELSKAQQQINSLQRDLAKKDQLLIKHGIKEVTSEIPEMTQGDRERLIGLVG